MKNLDEDSWIAICRFLSPKNIWKLLLSLNLFAVIFSNSSTLLRKFTLLIDKTNFNTLLETQSLSSIPFRNIFFNCDTIELNTVSRLLKNYGNSVEELTLNNLQCYEIPYNIFPKFTNLKSLCLENCKIFADKINPLPLISSLKSILFHNCNEYFIKIFEGQKNVEKLTIRNHKYTFNGFPHEEFNKLIKKLTNLIHLVFDGDGTSSYFDTDKFPFKVKILETTSITFHWYIGLRTPRLSFLKSQLGVLKELTIHKLPFDFDGDKVLKFILEEMQLNKFYYGKIPLILNGVKQGIAEFSATETQIKSAFEMFRQFKYIKKFSLILNNTDICSDSIENVINPRTDLFNSLNEFELIDNSEFRGLLGVFLGLYQNLTNIKKLTFETQDRNIKVILEECLPYMRNLEEISLTFKGPNAKSNFEIIKKLVSRLKKLRVPVDLVSIAKQVFDDRVEIEEICK